MPPLCLIRLKNGFGIAAGATCRTIERSRCWSLIPASGSLDRARLRCTWFAI